jgi:cellulose synthase/poly-beta-1,6-N-acetylglucosamine synthase-like glycosyltransferase
VILLEILIFLSTLFPIIHLLQAVSIAFKDRKHKKVNFNMTNEFSIIIPCYNEEDVIYTSIEGIKRLNYDKYEVIYVNDGSTDDTFDVLDKYLKLEQKFFKSSQGQSSKITGFYKSTVYENFYVLDKLNDGKAESLNAGIAFASHEFIITLDADSVLEKDSLCVIDNTFSDEKIIAAGGVVHVMQSSFSSNGGSIKNGLIKLQALDYIKGFYIYKASLACEDALAIISGAFGIFRKNVLKEVGGYRNTLGEDIDITLRFQQYALKNNKVIKFIPEAICYTECPESWTDLFKQRIRWQKAFIDCLIRFWFFIIRYSLTKPVFFYLVIEAFGVGMTSSIFTIVMGITALFSSSSKILLTFVFYYIISTVFGLIYSLTAIKISNTYSERKYNIKYFRTTLILDLFFYRYVNLFYYLAGSVLYFFNRKSWNKVKRSKRTYELSPQYSSKEA